MRMLADWVLPAQTVWSNRYEWSPARQTARRTVGGGMVLWAQKLHGGRPITLEFPPGRVWLTLDDIAYLIGLASAPGALHVFNWDGETHTVAFDRDKTPHVFEPVFGYNSPDNDRYTGQINLITV